MGAQPHAAGMRIGGLRVEPPVVLAPMSGIGDRPFRLLCRQAGAGLVWTGLISANAVHFRNPRTDDLLVFAAEEHPVCAQVFGADPYIVAEGALRAEAAGADMVDINMGCSVPKVLKGRAGAALMADPERAEAIVRAAARAVRVPLGVKMRTGWLDRGEQAPALARRCEAAGAAVVTVHPRWVGQRFRGAADWSVIAEVRQAVAVPVIGNGDVGSPEAAVRMRGETGCDAVMIGRAALGAPWIFERAAAALRGRPLPEPPTAGEQLAVAARHIRLAVEDRGPARGAVEMRKHLGWYLRGLPGARTLREKVNRAETGEELLGVLEAARAAVRAERDAARAR